MQYRWKQISFTAGLVLLAVLASGCSRNMERAAHTAADQVAVLQMELLQKVLTPHGISAEEIADPIGVFMHTVPHPDTRVMEIQEPVSKPGDRFAIRAEVDLLLAASTCPMDVIAPTNGWHITPLEIEVLQPA